MNVLIQRIYNQNNQETGAILSVEAGTATTIKQKNFIESQLVQYAFEQLYPEQGLHIYREMHVDLPSITVIKNIADLSKQNITI
jgi:hypothetical protein